MTIDSIYIILAAVAIVALAVVLIWPAARRSLRQFGRTIWPVARQILGWLCIILGLLGLVLPLLQGVLFLAIGIALLGRRNPVVRRARFVLKSRLRYWSRMGGLPGWIGVRGLTTLNKLSAQLRRVRARLRSKVQKA